jgi:hypothetical protein
MSNLAVIQSIRQSRQAEMESNDMHTLLSVEGTIESCVKNSQLLKGRIDNTIELVSLLLKCAFELSRSTTSNACPDQLYLDDPQSGGDSKTDSGDQGAHGGNQQRHQETNPDR